MSISGYNHDDLVNILEKSAFRKQNVNKLLKAVNKKEGKLELKDNIITFTPKHGKTITIDLVKAENKKSWTFSRYFNYSRKNQDFKKEYHGKIDAFVKKLLQTENAQNENPDPATGSHFSSTSTENATVSSESSEYPSSSESSEDPIIFNPANPLAAAVDSSSESELEPVALINKFSSDQMKTFRAILLNSPGKQISIPIEGTPLQGKKLVVWYNETHKAINLQPVNYYNAHSQEEKMGLIINNDGKITSIYVDGASHEDLNVPDNYEPLLKACYYESLKRSSDYAYNDFANAVDIKAVYKGVEEIPEDHLSKLCPLIAQRPGAILKIKQLNSDLAVAPGIDAGGPARDYLDNLGKGLKQSKNLKMVSLEGDTSVFPVTKGPLFSNEEAMHYENIGALLMFCYNSDYQQNYCIGQCFNPAVFSAALALKSSDIDSQKLSLSAQKNMIQAFLNASMVNTPQSTKNDVINSALHLFDWVPLPGQLVPDDEVLKAAHGILGNCPNPEAYFKFMKDEDNFDYSPNFDMIKANLPEFVEASRAAILTQNLDDLPHLGDCLEPIHHMARGMKEMCSLGNINQNDQKWDAQYFEMNFLEFNKKAQGSLDRNEIISKFVPNLMPPSNGFALATGKQEIDKKITWLKEWITDKDNTTNAEVEAFLKFTTGSSSLAPNAQILFKYMDAHSPQPFPISHSCFNMMELAQTPCGDNEYNDHTKEGFIGCLKTALSQMGYDMG